MSVMIEWINFLLLNVSAILSFSIYIISVIPSILEKRIGDKAWKLSKISRVLSDILFLLILVNMFMWIWFPINQFNWKFMQNPVIPVIIAIFLAIPFILIIAKSIIDAGKETIEPSRNTELYAGIYKYVRHPQMAATIPLFSIICFGLNSIFLLVWMTGLMVLIVPIVIYFEEKDLVEKYGELYLSYKKNTGAILPKFRRSKLDSR